MHRSNKATVKLHNIQEEMGLLVKCLVNDMSTRRNSTFYMLERLLEHLCSHDNGCRRLIHTPPVVLDEGQSSYCSLLKKQHVTCEDVTSLSSLIPCVQALKASLDKPLVHAEVQSLTEARKLATTLTTLSVECFQPVFDDPTGPYFNVTLLDPSFKNMPKSLLIESD